MTDILEPEETGVGGLQLLGKIESSSDRPCERKSLSGEDLCLLHWDDVFAFFWTIMCFSSVIVRDSGGVWVSLFK